MTIDPAAARSGSIISDNPNYLAAWLCYINGVEVPILGYSVSYGVWQIPEFTIYMVPDVLIARLGYEDRVPVQIFYLDYWVNPGSPEFRLLVDGEIIARSRGTTMGQRTQSFHCLAHINVFEDLTFFFMNTVDDVVSSQSPEIQSTGLTSPGLFYPHSLFHTGLVAGTNTGRLENAQGAPVLTTGQTPAARRVALRRGITDVSGEDDPTTTADEPIKSAFEMVYNVIRGIIGQTVPADRKSIPAMNFFARHTRKTRLHNRFVRMPILEDIALLQDRKGVFPIFNAVRSDEALAAMQRQIAGRVANSGSVWEVLKQALSLVYMEIAMIPTAPCVQTNLDGEIVRLLSSESDIVIQTVPAEPPVGTTDRANNSLNPTTATSGNEPARRQQALQALEQQVRAADARIADVQRRLNTLNGVQAGGRGTSVDVSWSSGFARRVGNLTNSPQHQTAGRITRELTALQAQRMTLVQQTEDARARAAEQPVVRASDETPATPPTPRPTGSSRFGTAPTAPIRLAQFYVKPQFLFGITPASNVIYPSQIDDWNDEENYRNQPTRTYVNDSVMTSALRATGSQQDLLLHALTVAWPEEADAVLHRQVGNDPGGVENATGTPTVTAGAPSQRLTGKDLLIWPEEYYKGPKVRRFSLPSWFQFLQQMRNTPVDGAAAGATAPGVAPQSGATPQPGAATGNPAFTTNHTGGTPPQSAVLTAEQQQQLAAANFAIATRGTPRVALSDANHPIDTWVPSARTRAIGAPRHFPYRNADQTGIDLVTKMPTAPGVVRQLPMRPGALAFAEFIRGNFRPYVTSVGTRRSGRRASFPGKRDQHNHGRALDIMITPVNQRANNIYGNPIADWLVENAKLIGIQLVIWGRYLWSSEPFGSSGSRFKYYSVDASPRDLSSWHCDHIHMELTDEACLLQTQWFTNPESQRSAPLPAIAGNPSTLPRVIVSRTTAVSTPATRQVTRVTTTVSNGNTPASNAPGTVVGGQPLPNQPPAAGQTTTVTGTPPSDAPETPESFQNLFRLYAQYEHSKGRYNERQGSLSLQFNPYLVPGFPVTIFDSMTTRLHAVAYLVNVTHSAMASGQYGTKASVSCVRTFPEFIQDVRNDCERFAQRLVAAPAEIIDEIRNVIQKEDQAEILYRRLFYGTDRPDSLKAAFVFTEAMGYADGLDVTPVEIRETSETSSTTVTTPAQAPAPGTPPTPAQNVATLEARLSSITTQIDTDGPRYTAMLRALENNIFGSRAEANQLAERLIQARADKVRITEELRRAREAAATAGPEASATPETTTTTETRSSVIHSLDPNRELSPIPGTPYYEAFDRYDTAMQLAARPICTLAQYIRFLHAGRRISDLVATADVEVGTNEFTYSLVIDRDLDAESPDTEAPQKAYTAQSYARIFRLRQGPGTPPTEGQRGYSSGTAQGPSTTREGVPADYPQTRADWDTALIAYREKIRFRVSPGS